MAKTAMLLVLLATVLMLAVTHFRTAAATSGSLLANPIHNAPHGNVRGLTDRIRRLLNEGETPMVLNAGECAALPVSVNNIVGGPNSQCNELDLWQDYPIAPGICGSVYDTIDGTGSPAQVNSFCATQNTAGKLWSPHSNAERCLMTVAVGFGLTAQTFVTTITDAAVEGTYVDADGVTIDETYLTWAAGEPTGEAEDCVYFLNNEAYDADCSTLTGIGFCIGRSPNST